MTTKVLTESQRAFYLAGLGWILEQIPACARSGRLHLNTNDVVVFFEVFEGGKKADVCSVRRDEMLDILKECVPEAPLSIAILSKPAPIDSVYVLVTYHSDVWCVSYRIPSSEGVLN